MAGKPLRNEELTPAFTSDTVGNFHNSRKDGDAPDFPDTLQGAGHHGSFDNVAAPGEKSNNG